MNPGAAVSGYYFSHPESRYFGVSEIGRDQVSDYAKRKGMTLEEAEKWLSLNLGLELEFSCELSISVIIRYKEFVSLCKLIGEYFA